MLIDPFDFKEILYPISLEDFFANYWEKKPLILKGHEREGYKQIISFEEVEYLLTTFPIAARKDHDQIQWIRLINNKIEKNIFEYTTNSEATLSSGSSTTFLDKSKVLAGYECGDTIILNGIEYRFEPVRRLVENFETIFGHYVGTNLFLTPPTAQGFQAHFDPYDVFILQLEGEKLWKIYDSHIPNPLPNQNVPILEKLSTPIDELYLKPGELVYIPRGFVHEASTAKEHSLHLSVGIRFYSKMDFLLELANSVPELRKALPIGFNSDTIYNSYPYSTLEKMLNDREGCTKAIEKIKNRMKKERIAPFHIGIKQTLG